MDVNAQWDDENKTIIRYEVKGQNWNWDDLHATIDQVKTMLDKLDYKVDVIVHVQDVVRLPRDVMLHFRRMTANRHPNRGLSVFVGDSIFAQILLETFNKVYRGPAGRVQLASSLEEARLLLAEAKNGQIST